MINHLHINSYQVPEVLQITAAGWDGQIFRMSRHAYFDWRESAKQWSGPAAVYILYADHFDKTDGKQLYIGRTGDPIRRGNEHETAKQEWTAALIFTSMGDWMSTTHIEAIEARFIKWAKLASRYTVTNGTEGAANPNAGKADQLLIDAYLTPVLKIVQMAGIDVFSQNPRGLFTLKKMDQRRHGNQEGICTVRIVDGAAGLFEVLANSSLQMRMLPKSEGTSSRPHQDQVNSLIASGHAIYKDGFLSFIQNTQVQAEWNVINWKLFGHYLTEWSDANRRKLSDVAKPPSVKPIPLDRGSAAD